VTGLEMNSRRKLTTRILAQRALCADGYPRPRTNCARREGAA
jgi:hypothetical protein